PRTICPHHLFLLMSRPPPRPPLLPYTTLFRSSPSPSSIHLAHTYSSLESTSPPYSPRRPRPSSSPHHRLHSPLFLCTSTHPPTRSEEHTSELQSRENLVCRLLLGKKKNIAPRI